MYEKYAIKNLSEALIDVIIPEFRDYIKEQQNSPIINKRVEEKIAEIERLEDSIADMTSPFDMFENNSGIWIKGWTFTYNEISGDFKFEGNKEYTAKSKVWSEEGLTNGWRAEQFIRTRIEAVLSTVEPDSFDNILNLVKAQIDFKGMLILANK